MRITGGAWGSRRIVAPRGQATRPTSDRARESLFAILGALDGLTVLDLFAGSGALGLEALSRGAAHATFVDRAAPALTAVRANLEALDASAERFSCRGEPARRVARDAVASGQTFDLVLVDPPYTDGPALAAELPLAQLLAPGGRLVWESDRRLTPTIPLPQADERRYGDTLIRIFSQA